MDEPEIILCERRGDWLLWLIADTDGLFYQGCALPARCVDDEDSLPEGVEIMKADSLAPRVACVFKNYDLEPEDVYVRETTYVYKPRIDRVKLEPLW